MTDLDFICKRCGRENTRETDEWEVSEDCMGRWETWTETELFNHTCECGCFLYENEEDDDIGIRELIQDADYQLDDNGYLFEVEEDCDDCDEMKIMFRPSLKDIANNYDDPSLEIKYFIRKERPENFKPFTLWDGREIK